MILEDINAFVAVAKSGSFNKAAIELCVAQSALSKRVKRLETRMGSELFERHTKGVYLTAIGKIFMDKAQQIIDDLASLENELSLASVNPYGRVNMGLPQRTSSILGPKIIKRQMHELKNVELDIFEGSPLELHHLLSAGQIDIALSYNSEVGNDYDCRPILVEPLFLYCHKDILNRCFDGQIPEQLSITDLERIPLIMPRKPHILRVLLDRVVSLHHISRNIVFETDGNYLIRGSVQAGVAGSIFSNSSDVWNNLTTSGNIVSLPFKSPLMSWTLFLIRSKSSINNLAVNRVIDIIDEEINQLMEQNYWPSARRIFHISNTGKLSL